MAPGWKRTLALGLASVLAAGTALVGLGAGPAQAAPPVITKQPAGQTISEGGTATFAVVASDVGTVKWQSTTTVLANGEPDGTTWADVPGATQVSLPVQGTDAATQHGTFYRTILNNGADAVTSQPAQLRFFEKLSTSAAVTVSGESYGPVTPNKPFSVSAPNAVVRGEPIVITGTGYLAVDGTTGSVATFLVDASYSGDPNTLSTTREVINPVTSGVSGDKRLHAIVQAGADGTWRAEIPWPDHTNTTANEAFFATNWAEGTHHMVRILTGSTLTGDYQRGISVRFTVVDEPTEPALIETPAPAGGVLITPRNVRLGQPITVSGREFFLTEEAGGAGGSGGPVFINQPSGGTGPVNVSGRTIENQIPSSTYSDPRAHGVFHSDSAGNWSLTFPFPTPENSTLTTETAWQVGQTQRIRILTGSLVSGDRARSVFADFTIVAGEPEPAGEIAVTNGTVEQYGDVWFNLSDFEPGAEVTIELANGAGDAVVSKPFTIGADGNTANPDGQTYRKLTVPRGAAPGAYLLKVRDAGSSVVLATSDPVTVAAATTRVFNPGDHAGGQEDLLVQRGGVWTFHAVGFAPTGKLTATAQVGGQILSGPGQISDSEKAWQLDANGDTLREPAFTRVQIPTGVAPGEFAIVFSDGTKTVIRTVIVEAPSQAAVTVGASAELGGTIHVTGEGFVHPNGGGSRIAIKLNEGAYSRVDASLHANKTIWWIVEADEHGNFAIDMPVPNGTEADADGTLGSSPVVVPGAGFTLRFLTGSLKPADQSRTLLSTPFSITEKTPEQPPGKALTKTPTPKISGTGKVGKTLKVKAGTWKPAKVKLAYRWLRDGEPIAKATKTKYKLTKADAGRRITVAVTGSKSGYASVTKTSKAKSVARVKASISLSAPKKLAPGIASSATITVKGALANPTGTVTVKAAGATLTVPVTAEDHGKVRVDLPAFTKSGKQKVKAVFTPDWATAVSTSPSSTVSKTVKVAKVKASLKLAVPGTVAVGAESAATVTVKAAAPNPVGQVKVTVNGETLTAELTADNAGVITVTLPAIGKRGSYKVKASFTPTGETTVSTSKSSTVSKTLKVR